MTTAETQDYTILSASTSNAEDTLSYSGVREVLVNSPTVLRGSYNPQRVAKVTLMAEDKYALGITLDSANKTWQLALDKGFQASGNRWLRLKAFDTAGKEIANLVIYITVSNNPLALGRLSLKVLQDTVFKAQPIDSSKLNANQKATVKAGQTFEVIRYGYSDGHLKLKLKDAIAPVGDFGYIYETFAELKKGNTVLRFDIGDVPTTPLSAQALIITPTTFKSQPVDSSQLQANQKVDLFQGQSLRIVGYACLKGHFRFTLAEDLPGIGNVGYVYWQHVQVKHGDEVIPYDSAALTITATKTTIFKKQPVDSAKLSDKDKYNFPKGGYYGVSSYALEAGHLKVSLTEELPGFGNTGYLFPGFVQLKRGGKIFNPFPPQVEMNIPYFSQRDNPRSPGSTCNVTSIAMAFYYLGLRSKGYGQLENELLQWVINRYGHDQQTDNNILAELIKAYGFKNSSFSTQRKWAEVKNELISRRPVVLGGDFTASGHIVCLIGFTPQGFIVNDPWGDALTGYTDFNGRKLLYPYSYMDRVAGPDGNVWAHFIRK